MKVKSSIAAAAFILGIAASVRADGLEPEDGVFAGSFAPSPYKLRLRQAFLANDHDRLCQMLFVSSIQRESAVYIIRQEDGRQSERKARFIVVSRTLKDQLWPRLLKEMEKASPTKNHLDSKHEATALERIRTAVESKTAVLDDESAEAVVQACQHVLSEVRYPKQQRVVRDGGTYHACHGSFCGKTQSPDVGTVAADFVVMEMALQSYAEAPKEKQGPIKVDLVQKARRLTARMGGRKVGL